MRLSTCIGFLLVMLTCLSINSYGQEVVRNKSAELQKQRGKQERRNFYRQVLQVDSAKAEQISDAQDAYKEGLKAVMADTTLNDGARRVKIELLMETKNEKLKKLLNAAQQKKLIPTTESKFLKDKELKR